MDIVKAVIVGAGLTNCRLTVQNEVMDDVLRYSGDIKDHVMKSMSDLLARQMMTKGLLISEANHASLSTKFTMKVWSFSDDELRQLIRYCFEAAEEGKTL